MPLDLPLGDYIPDAPDFEHPGSILQKNVVPIDGGVGPLPSLQPLTDPIGNSFPNPNVFSADWLLTRINAFGSGSVANTTDTLDPNGGNTAEFIQEDNTVTATHRINRTGLLVNPQEPVRAVLYAKKELRTTIALSVFETGGTNGVTIAVDLDGIVSYAANNAGTGTNAAATVELVNNGWYKIVLTGTPSTTGTTSQVQVNLYDNSVPPQFTYSGDNTSGAYVWGASLTPDIRCQGAISVQSLSEAIFNFAGNATALNKLDSDGRTWLDVTRASGVYATPSDGRWSFAQFGNIIAAANGVDAIQAYTMGSSSQFAALAASAPIATYLATVRNFLVAGNIAGTSSQRVQWSPIGAPAGTWGTVPATQADYQDLGDMGPVTGLHGDDVGLVWQTRALTRMTYEGPPTIFRFDQIAHVGCVAPGSLAKWGDFIFWLAEDGFFALTGEGQITPIGSSRVDRAFLRDVNLAYYDRISGAIDPIGGRYFVAYASNSSSGNPDKLLIYDWRRDRWTTADMDVELLLTLIPQAGYTLDSLDSVSLSIDALPYSLDSRQWIGSGRPLLGAFDTNHQLGATAGPSLAATADTTEGQFNPAGRAYVTEARVMVDTDDYTLSLGTRGKISEAVTYGTAVSPSDTTGLCYLRSEGRYHRARIEIEAGATWTALQGLNEIRAESGARR